MKFWKIYIWLAFLAFSMASLGYAFLCVLMDRVYAGPGPNFSYHQYHHQHPYQYIALVALVYALVGSLWYRCCRTAKWWLRYTSLILVIPVSLVISSIPGGVLWKLHDMHAGFYTRGEVLWRDLYLGAKQGLKLGWRLMLLSFPYNVLGYLIGTYLLLFLGTKNKGAETSSEIQS